jgi:hypothetical protein
MATIGDPISWRIGDDPDGRVTLLEDGGADAIYDGSHGATARLDSTGSASPLGGLLFEVEIPQAPVVGAFEINLFPEPQAYYEFEGSYHWFCIQDRDPSTFVLTGPFYLWPETFGADTFADPLKRIAIPGDRPYIYLRPDGIVEYGVNFGPLSRPIYVSSKAITPGVNYKASITFGSFDYPNYRTSGIRKPRWIRSNPAFRLKAGVQRRIFELDDIDPLPPTIEARVRQIQTLPYGHYSNWTEGTFNR